MRPWRFSPRFLSRSVLLGALALPAFGAAAEPSGLSETPGAPVAHTVAIDMGQRAEAVVRLLFVGDVMLDDGPGRALAAGRDPFADFDAEFRAADLRIGNLECPVATSGTATPDKVYTFRASPGVIDRLSGRFDALSVANNHSGDYGREAFVETLTLLDMAGIKAVGGGRNLTEAHRAYRVERSGLHIAVLAYNEFKPRAFEAGPDWPGIAWSEDSQVVRDIRQARADGADLVIPFMHWGWEREPGPTPRQRQLARLMIDAGADAVVGSHPHVTQGSETYKGKPVIYSLGNFVFDGFASPATREGWLLQLTVGRSGVSDWNAVPAYIDAEGIPRRAPPRPAVTLAEPPAASVVPPVQQAPVQAPATSPAVSQ